MVDETKGNLPQDQQPPVTPEVKETPVVTPEVKSTLSDEQVASLKESISKDVCEDIIDYARCILDADDRKPVIAVAIDGLPCVNIQKHSYHLPMGLFRHP
jgi:hypothetical protein